MIQYAERCLLSMESEKARVKTCCIVLNNKNNNKKKLLINKFNKDRLVFLYNLFSFLSLWDEKTQEGEV